MSKRLRSVNNQSPIGNVSQQIIKKCLLIRYTIIDDFIALPGTEYLI
jgi:hypothetical protein